MPCSPNSGSRPHDAPAAKRAGRLTCLAWWSGCVGGRRRFPSRRRPLSLAAILRAGSCGSRCGAIGSFAVSASGVARRSGPSGAWCAGDEGLGDAARGAAVRGACAAGHGAQGGVDRAVSSGARVRAAGRAAGVAGSLRVVAWRVAGGGQRRDRGGVRSAGSCRRPASSAGSDGSHESVSGRRVARAARGAQTSDACWWPVSGSVAQGDGTAHAAGPSAT